MNMRKKRWVKAKNSRRLCIRKSKDALNQQICLFPFLMGEYWYYIRYEADKEYGIYCRKRHTLENQEEIMLDANVLAQGHELFFSRKLDGEFQ